MRKANRNIDEIGRAVGYESAPSFSQTFTRLTGQAPGRYRRSLQSSDVKPTIRVPDRQSQKRKSRGEPRLFDA
ncbi:helix-turn-helix domain-containing protein [Mesorhizobium newzealandense]|uniref:Helix-turn-helix domain-containing protein n=1 Tax=Mesorhizobium newzealandense TaxID=1300302 RepID=A0ABW4U7D9_9HYPH